MGERRKKRQKLDYFAPREDEISIAVFEFAGGAVDGQRVVLLKFGDVNICLPAETAIELGKDMRAYGKKILRHEAGGEAE